MSFFDLVETELSFSPKFWARSVLFPKKKTLVRPGCAWLALKLKKKKKQEQTKKLARRKKELTNERKFKKTAAKKLAKRNKKNMAKNWRPKSSNFPGPYIGSI